MCYFKILVTGWEKGLKIKHTCRHLNRPNPNLDADAFTYNWTNNIRALWNWYNYTGKQLHNNKQTNKRSAKRTCFPNRQRKMVNYSTFFIFTYWWINRCAKCSWMQHNKHRSVLCDSHGKPWIVTTCEGWRSKYSLLTSGGEFGPLFCFHFFVVFSFLHRAGVCKFEFGSFHINAVRFVIALALYSWTSLGR